MKNARYKLIVLLFIALSFPHLLFSQDDSSFDLAYEVNRTYPSLSITKKQLNEASTLIDINKYYKPSWIKEYISVETLASYQGKTKKVVSKNDSLNQAQKDMMNTVDVGTDITVKIHYIPSNQLKHNDAKETSFTFTIEPESEATYFGGIQQLQQYLKENVGDKISDDVFNIYHLTAVKFTIDKQGQIIDAHVFESSKDEKTDDLLLEAICNMPNWKPAQYADGTKVKQEFVLTVGDHRSCVINLLNIRRS